MGEREFPNARQAVEYLESRMAERRARERRQKLLDDIKLIRRRRNGVIDIPILPPGHNQKMWFAKLDANGIWEKVFAFLTSPSDVSSAYFACEIFKKHLEEKRKMLHLRKVFGILRDTGHLRYVMDPYLRRVLKKNQNDVLHLRLVSKAWKTATDNQFLEVPLGFSHTNWHLKCTTKSNSVFVMNSSSEIQCFFRSIEEVDDAMEALRTSTSCSSLIRTILVDDENCEDRESFYSKLGRFLDIHGHSVWGLKFLQEADFNYERLWDLVARMPHLKALHLFYDRGSDINFDMDVANAQLLGLMVQMPFPTLPSLELCKFNGFPAPGGLLLVEILSKNLSVKTVSLDLRKRCGNDGYLMSNYVWDTLSRLRLEHFNWTLMGFGYGYPENIFLERISQMRGFDWPLKALHNYYDVFGELDFTLGTFFEVLNRFHRALEEVSARCRSQNRSLFSDNNDGFNVVNDFSKLRKIDVVARVTD